MSIVFEPASKDMSVVAAEEIHISILTDRSLSSPPASSMPLSVGSSATKSSSLHSSRERQHYASLRNHPYQRSLSNQGSSTSHRETHSRRTSLSANDCHCFLATVGDLCVARPNEDPLEYASRVAARDAKAQDYEGRSKF